MRAPLVEDPPVVIQTPYPADLDPLHRTPRHLSLTLLDLKAKRPFSMVPERSIRPLYKIIFRFNLIKCPANPRAIF